MGKSKEVLTLIAELKKNAKEKNAKIWHDIAKRFEKPLRNWSEVNLWKIEKYLKNDEIGIVAGKVLGVGEIKRPVKIAAYSFSRKAKEKIEFVGGKGMSIRELLSLNPSGKNVRILR
ncbi:MAG: 50S ribosomal protein L18e [Candidatus Thermoplasmatota archaeon]